MGVEGGEMKDDKEMIKERQSQPSRRRVVITKGKKQVSKGSSEEFFEFKDDVDSATNGSIEDCIGLK